MKALVVARKGEQLVKDLLPGANWINGEAESGENYDLFWNGIKINVKTSCQTVPSSKNAYQFSMNNSVGDNILILMVGLAHDEPYFWLETGELKSVYYKKIADGIKKSSLIEAINEKMLHT